MSKQLMKMRVVSDGIIERGWLFWNNIYIEKNIEKDKYIDYRYSSQLAVNLNNI